MEEAGSLRKVVYEFSTEEDQELALAVGDIVQVLRRVDKQWCYGMCNGRKGNFPSGFTIDVPIPPLGEKQEIFAPIAKFQTEEVGDLSFVKGDLITGIRPVDSNWWEGECNKLRGIFPVTHAWKIDRSILISPPAPQKVSKKARVKMDLKAQLSGELDLVKDDIVYITEEIDRSWFRGYANGKSGMFPSSYVTVISDGDQCIPDHIQVDSVSHSRQASIDSSTADQYGYDCLNSGISAYGRTTYAFQGKYADELTFGSGEIVKLLRYVDENWLEGEVNGRTGIFPKNFIDIIVDCPSSGSKEFEASMFPPDTYARVLHNYSLPNSSEVALTEGGTVTILRKINDNFYEVETDSGATCICPITVVEVIGNGPDQLPPSYSEVIACDSNSQFSLPHWNSHSSDSTTKSDRPLSYPTSSFDQHSTTRTNTNFKGSQSINDKIAENLVFLDTSRTSGDKNRSPNFSQKSYSLATGNTSPMSWNNVPPTQPILPAVNNSTSENSYPSSNYENVSTNPSSWDTVEDVSTTCKVPGRPPPPRKTDFQAATNTATSQEVNNGRSSSPTLSLERKSEMELQKRTLERKKKMKEQRECVITEILHTERDYKSDLQIMHDIFLADADQAKKKGIDVSILFGNLDEVIDVSNQLQRRLKKVSQENPDSQMIGQCFVDISDDMKQVYGHYCRNHDDVNSVLDKYGEQTAAGMYLKHKVELMKRQTNCFDLPSMLIKPVQRILKYPLLLNELVKCTEDDHPDKQGVIQAIGLMTDVATAINEFKRRKDLVFKYRKHADTSFSGKISKFSIHSMLKKSSRFGMRLSSSIGLRHVTKDENFLKVEREFHSLMKTTKIFIKDVETYISKMEDLVKTAFRIAEDIADLYQEKKNQQEVDHFRSVHRIIVTQHWEANKQVLDRNVLNILRELLDTFTGPSNLIQKRYDKLLDYEACSNKLEKNKDVTKLKMLQDNLHGAKNTYEALNSQLLDDLPKLYASSIAILHDCIFCFLKAKKNFMGKSAREFLSLAELPLLLGSKGNILSDILETFQVKHTLVTDNLSRMTIVPKQLFPSSLSSSMKRNSSPGIARLSFGSSAQSKANLKQIPKDQTFIKSTYRSGDLYVSCKNYDAVDLLDLSLQQGDIVGVVKKQDPMGSQLRWFVDKGAAKGFVPANILKKHETTPDQGKRGRPSISRPMASGRGNTISPKSETIPHNLNPSLDTTPPLNPSASTTSGNMPSRESEKDSADGLPHKYEEIDDLMRQYEAIPENPSSNASTTSATSPDLSVAEFDPYRATNQGLYDNVPGGDPNSGHQYEVIPEKQTSPTNEYFYAQFDFNPIGPRQLKVVKGQVVLVLQRCDLNKNSEWWFVEDRHGNQGYVPANYLRCYPLSC